MTLEWERDGTWGLPNTWRYEDGRTVSNYHLLSDKAHEADGWTLKEKPLPVKDDTPPEPTIEERLATLERKVKTLEGVKG